MDLGLILIGFDRFSIKIGWKWVRIDGKGYTNTTYISEFHPHIPKPWFRILFLIICRLFICLNLKPDWYELILIWVYMDIWIYGCIKTMVGSSWGGRRPPPHPRVYEGLRPSNSLGWEETNKPIKPIKPTKPMVVCSRTVCLLRGRASEVRMANDKQFSWFLWFVNHSSRIFGKEGREMDGGMVGKTFGRLVLCANFSFVFFGFNSLVSHAYLLSGKFDPEDWFQPNRVRQNG